MFFECLVIQMSGILFCLFSWKLSKKGISLQNHKNVLLIQLWYNSLHGHLNTGEVCIKKKLFWWVASDYEFIISVPLAAGLEVFKVCSTHGGIERIFVRHKELLLTFRNTRSEKIVIKQIHCKCVNENQTGFCWFWFDFFVCLLVLVFFSHLEINMAFNRISLWGCD